MFSGGNIYLPTFLTSQGKTVVSAVATRHVFPVVMKDGERSTSGTDFEATVNKNVFHQYYEIAPIIRKIWFCFDNEVSLLCKV